MFNNLILKGRKICDCGREFDIHDIKKLERIDDNSFYAGVVKHYSKTNCPKCNKEVILLLKQIGQTYEIINVAEEISDTKIKANKVVEEEKNKDLIKKIADINENTTEEATIDIDTKEVSSKEFICQECGKALKTKSGLTNHLNVHQK